MYVLQCGLSSDFVNVCACSLMCDCANEKNKQQTNIVMIITTGISTQGTHSLHISTSTKKNSIFKIFIFRRQCNRVTHYRRKYISKKKQQQQKLRTLTTNVTLHNLISSKIWSIFILSHTHNTTQHIFRA